MEPISLVIGNKNYSSWSLRPWLVLKHVGVPFDEVMVRLDTPDTAAQIRERSPSGRVPALHHGDLVVWDSLAICEYLAEQYPRAALWPDDRVPRAVARSVAAEMHAGFSALRGAMTMNIRRRPSPIEVGDDVRADIARVLSLWATCRRDHGQGGPFLFGRFTIADAMFAPVVTRFRSYAVPLDGVAAAYAEAVWRLPAMTEWAEAAAAEPWIIGRYESAPAEKTSR